MPSTSKKQHNFMAAVANNPAFAKKVEVPQSVGQDFATADKGKKFGGTRSRADLQKINKPETRQGKSELFKKGGEMKDSKAMLGKEMAFMKKKGAPASMMKHEKAEMMGMKKGGMKKMADGGMPMKDGKPAFIGDGKGAMKHGGMAKKMASGGSASSRADGIAQKGKTKGKMMAKGGRAC
jgi:hypothetical protein